MFSYFAYGLGIHSTLPLPEFLPTKIACDVLVRLGGHESLSSEVSGLETSGQQRYLKVTPEEAILFFKHVGTFLVRQGREIIVIPAPGADVRLIQLYLVEAIMAVLLYQRGLFVLHASAVEVGGEAIAFLGNPGQGKSSMAAALHARGHGIMADDVTAVNFSADSVTVLPGFPQLKVSPEVAAPLGYDLESLLVIHPLEEKRAYRDIGGFPRRRLPLKGIYVYMSAFDDRPQIAPLRPQETVVELVRHSYGVRLFQQPNPVSHFLQCARLARSVSAYRLNRSHCLSSLPHLARLVEEHHVRHRQ